MQYTTLKTFSTPCGIKVGDHVKRIAFVNVAGKRIEEVPNLTVEKVTITVSEDMPVMYHVHCIDERGYPVKGPARLFSQY